MRLESSRAALGMEAGQAPRGRRRLPFPAATRFVCSVKALCPKPGSPKAPFLADGSPKNTWTHVAPLSVCCWRETLKPTISWDKPWNWVNELFFLVWVTWFLELPHDLSSLGVSEAVARRDSGIQRVRRSAAPRLYSTSTSGMGQARVPEVLSHICHGEKVQPACAQNTQPRWPRTLTCASDLS